MSDDLTPGHVRDRRFDVTRKGYDRGEVDSFLAEVADRLTELEEAVADAATRIDVGISDHEALARELDTIGAEVAEILESARSAAAGMRTRATEDADRWRAEARAEADALRVDATDQSRELRAAAWNDGSSMLASADAEARAILAAAREEALFVRAEAEREALRLTGDAKRDREELLRAARLEADQVVDAARVESEGVLAAANQQAEFAQERARALEERRAELLTELEAARSSITELESEIEDRQRELEEPPEPEPEAIVGPSESERSHHGEDGGSVRIVAHRKVEPLKPVDAEELVAEVEAIRAGITSEPEPPPMPAIAGVPPVAPVEDLPAPPPPVDRPDATGESTPTESDESPVAAGATADEPASSPTDEAEAGEQVQVPPVEAEQEPPDDAGRREVSEDVHEEAPPPAATPSGTTIDEATPDERAARDDLSSLFAQLRSGPADGEPSGGAPADTGRGDGDRTDAPETADPSAPNRSEDTVPRPRPDDAARPADAVSPRAASEAVTPAEPDEAELIPLRNSALRAIKRTLVDLQNETLEHLRTDAGWFPDEGFTDRFREPFDDLVHAVGAGGANAGAVFADDLYDAVSSAIERTRDAGGGEREVAAAASKVFRMWRSDEAERRVADATRSPSHA